MATTTGPWRVERGTTIAGCGDEYEVTADDGAVVIAQPPTEADARLIAAAPDMLRALRSLFAPGSGAAMHAECWELVRAAVRKATEGEPDACPPLDVDDADDPEECPHCGGTGEQTDGAVAFDCPECGGDGEIG